MIVEVTATPIQVPGLPHGALYTLVAGDSHLILRASPESGAAAVDTYAAPKGTKRGVALRALLTYAAALARTHKPRLRVSSHDSDAELTALLIELGFQRTASLIGQRTEFTREFL